MVHAAICEAFGQLRGGNQGSGHFPGKVSLKNRK